MYNTITNHIKNRFPTVYNKMKYRFLSTDDWNTIRERLRQMKQTIQAD